MTHRLILHVKFLKARGPLLIWHWRDFYLAIIILVIQKFQHRSSHMCDLTVQERS